MQIKQTIAIIGARSNMGSVISKRLSKGNYRLLLFGTVKDQMQSLVQEILTATPSADVETIDCSVYAGWEADIILIDIPYKAEKEVAEKIREVANQKIVISITNALYDSNKGFVKNQGIRVAEEMQHLLPNSKIVKVFHTSLTPGIPSQPTESKKNAILIAGNDKEALQTVFGIFAIAALNPVIAGDLTMSSPLEHME